MSADDAVTERISIAVELAFDKGWDIPQILREVLTQAENMLPPAPVQR